MERHNLLNEFPDFKEKIHELKVSNEHFRKLFDEYHEVEHEIHRIHNLNEIVSDEYAHKLKAKLLYLKDELFSLLNQ
jgi:uncharacterized protein YdcH (DUF465 family)